MASSLVRISITAYKYLLRCAFLFLIPLVLEFMRTENGVMGSLSPSATQASLALREYITLKITTVNKVLDEIVPLKLHGKLVKTTISLLRTWKNMLVNALIFLLKHVYKFVLAQIDSPCSDPLKPTKNFASTDMQSKGLSEFSLEKYMNSKLKGVNIGLDEAVPLKTPKKEGEAMRYSLLKGGKRLKTIVCIASCELVGGDEALAMPIACAVEFIHLCLSGAEEISNLASTALFYLAIEQVDMPLNRVVRVIVELCSAIWSDGLMAGQFGDLDCEGKKVSLEEELEHIHLNKTARLLQASVVCGAILGGGSVLDVERLRKYGSRMGLLFQVVDDILQVTEPTTEELGKTGRKDLTSDKATFPILMGIEKARNFAQKLVDQAVEELAHFDAARAVPLYHLAHLIADRLN